MRKLHAHRDTYAYAKFMPTQIVLFYSGGAAEGNRLCYEAAQTNRGNREGWVYNFCMDKNCTINQFVGRKKWRFGLTQVVGHNINRASIRRDPKNFHLMMFRKTTYLNTFTDLKFRSTPY